ncbi:aldo/keto reductase [soil metagenome]
MEIRDFGKTGLKVSLIGLGASHVGAASVSETDADKFLNEVLDLGVTLVDTARGYGSSEERIGKYIAHRRDEYVLSSKCGYSIPGTEDWTPACVAKGIDQALSLMKTDRIDIMHFHSCGLDVLQRNDVTAALLKAVEEGKVRVPAYSGENEARAFAIDSGDFKSIQTSVNICDQRVIEEALPKTIKAGYGMIAKRPIANAFWRFKTRPSGDYSEVYWSRAQSMLLSPGSLPWSEFALRFAAFTPGVHSCIVGTANMDHFKENLEFIKKGELPKEVVAETQKKFRDHDQGWTGQI